MMLRLIAVAGFIALFLAPFLLAVPAFAATPQQKMETCKFGADDKKLTGAARKSFMSKCMSNADSPRGTPAMPRPNPQ
jgi:hypothetical protein